MVTRTMRARNREQMTTVVEGLVITTCGYGGMRTRVFNTSGRAQYSISLRSHVTRYSGLNMPVNTAVRVVD